MVRAVALAVALVLSSLATLVGAWSPHAIAQEASPPADCPVTTAKENKELVRRYTLEYWDQGPANGDDALLADDFVYHWVEPAADFETWRTAFPDRTTTIDQIATEGDLVALRWTGTGTHQGEFVGIAPTGNTAEWSGNSMLRIECGKIAEVWVQLDVVGLFRQVGVSVGPPPQVITATPTAAQEAVAVSTPADECPATTAEENEDVIRRWYDEVWSQGNYGVIGDLIASSHVHERSVDLPVTGTAEYEANARRWRTSFPDLAFTVEELVAEGDLVVARWTATGTHQGDYYSIAATGNAVEWNGITLFQFACGKLAMSWIEADAFDFYRQLGVDVPMATPAAE